MVQFSNVANFITDGLYRMFNRISNAGYTMSKEKIVSKIQLSDIIYCYRCHCWIILSGSLLSLLEIDSTVLSIKYDKQDQQGMAAFNERSPHMTQQQEPVVRSPDEPQTKTG
jgi:hypothetical protein